MQIDIKILSDKLGSDIPLPKYATGGSAAMDIHACIEQDIILIPGERFPVPTGFAIAVPEGYGAFIFARSGLATKHGVALPNSVGVIDSDYRGEVLVALCNSSDKPFTIRSGDRIAQLAIMPVVRAELNITDELDSTARGEGGFGSTGI